MVETCHRQSCDVVVVESAAKSRRSTLTCHSYATFTTLLKKGIVNEEHGVYFLRYGYQGKKKSFF